MQRRNKNPKHCWDKRAVIIVTFTLNCKREETRNLFVTDKYLVIILNYFWMHSQCVARGQGTICRCLQNKRAKWPRSGCTCSVYELWRADPTSVMDIRFSRQHLLHQWKNSKTMAHHQQKLHRTNNSTVKLIAHFVFVELTLSFLHWDTALWKFVAGWTSAVIISVGS